MYRVNPSGATRSGVGSKILGAIPCRRLPSTYGAPSSRCTIRGAVYLCRALLGRCLESRGGVAKNSSKDEFWTSWLGASSTPTLQVPGGSFRSFENPVTLFNYPLDKGPKRGRMQQRMQCTHRRPQQVNLTVRQAQLCSSTNFFNFNFKLT